MPRAIVCAHCNTLVPYRRVATHAQECLMQWLSAPPPPDDLEDEPLQDEPLRAGIAEVPQAEGYQYTQDSRKVRRI